GIHAAVTTILPKAWIYGRSGSLKYLRQAGPLVQGTVPGTVGRPGHERATGVRVVAGDDLPGDDDVSRLGRWQQHNGITATGTPPRMRLIAGDRSNLPYLLEPGDDGTPLVLRRP